MSASAVAANSGLASTWTNSSESEARSIAEDLFGLGGRVTRFETEKDDTFRIDAQDGRRFVLKIANPDEPVEEIDFQLELLTHVAAVNPALPVPRVLESRRGRRLETIRGAGGAERHVRMLTYLEGTPLDSTQSSDGERRQVGRILAELRLATAGFSHPAALRKLAWDVQHMLDLVHLLVHIEDAGRRGRLERAIERFRDVRPRLDGCRRQVLHNDFSRSNIVVDHAAPSFVTGIIDFGDAVETAIAVDLSTAMLNQLPSTYEPDLFARNRPLLDGYLSVADLTETERAIVPHLVMARVVARALLTVWRAKVLPANARYILRNTEQGWAQLDWFLERSEDEVSSLFLER